MLMASGSKLPLQMLDLTIWETIDFECKLYGEKVRYFTNLCPLHYCHGVMGFHLCDIIYYFRDELLPVST